MKFNVRNLLIGLVIVIVLAVVIISRFTEGYFWGVFSSLFGVICVNFVFTYPFWAFNFRLTGYPLTFLTMLAVSLIISAMNTKIKKQERLRTFFRRFGNMTLRFINVDRLVSGVELTTNNAHMPTKSRALPIAVIGDSAISRIISGHLCQR